MGTSQICYKNSALIHENSFQTLGPSNNQVKLQKKKLNMSAGPSQINLSDKSFIYTFTYDGWTYLSINKCSREQYGNGKTKINNVALSAVEIHELMDHLPAIRQYMDDSNQVTIIIQKKSIMSKFYCSKQPVHRLYFWYFPIDIYNVLKKLNYRFYFSITMFMCHVTIIYQSNTKLHVQTSRQQNCIFMFIYYVRVTSYRWFVSLSNSFTYRKWDQLQLQLQFQLQLLQLLQPQFHQCWRY